MECIDFFWNPGEAVSADSSPGLDKDVPPVEGDNFQCTFFRPTKHESVILNENPPPFNSSDSEVEFDDPNITTGWAEASSINSDTFYSYDEEISQQDNKALDLPKVTFGQTYIHSDDTKLQLEKQESTKPEIVQLTEEKNYPKDVNNLKDKISEKEKLLLIKCVHNNRYTHGFPDPRYSLNRTKRSYNPVSSTNETPGKRRKIFENRTSKYKRLLKSMENVIHTMSEQESIKPRYKIAETNLVKMDPQKEQSQSQKIVADNPQADELEMRRPIFKKRELEKFLDESMQRAVKMYRTCRDTWNGTNEEQFEVSENFPKANISIPRLSKTASECKNT
ncbi:uncharacterized protein LOC117603213 [Osmia lignaria lignaria]|uniref:uncharacterized protein LOC117603213 n=1 Tax=Osmia lignaria lignaria TaxID=1437193 RepID=UPI001478F2AC|nr:uncharacterized protein LOC117603213 isoform X2 [Osmia lignaria]